MYVCTYVIYNETRTPSLFKKRAFVCKYGRTFTFSLDVHEVWSTNTYIHMYKYYHTYLDLKQIYVFIH